MSHPRTSRRQALQTAESQALHGDWLAANQLLINDYRHRVQPIWPEPETYCPLHLCPASHFELVDVVCRGGPGTPPIGFRWRHQPSAHAAIIPSTLVTDLAGNIEQVDDIDVDEWFAGRNRLPMQV